MLKSNGKMLQNKTRKKRKINRKNKDSLMNKSFVYRVQSNCIYSPVKSINLFKKILLIDISLFFY